MSKKSTTKKPTVPAMFTKNAPSSTTTDTTATTTTLKDDKPKIDRLVPWVEK